MGRGLPGHRQASCWVPEVLGLDLHPTPLTKGPGRGDGSEGEGNKHTESPESYNQLSVLVYVFLFQTAEGQEINGQEECSGVVAAGRAASGLPSHLSEQPLAPLGLLWHESYFTLVCVHADNFTPRCLRPGGRQLPSPQTVWSLSHRAPPPGTV